MVKFYTPKYKQLLVVPAILVVLFLVIIFAYPKVTLGLDFSGGTRIILQSSQSLEAGELEKVLREKFNLTDLKINAVQNPVGGESIRIEFAENNLITSARQNYQSALAVKASDPEQARTLALQSLESIGSSDPVPGDLTELLEFTREKLFDYSSNFSQQITEAISNAFSIPQSELQYTIEEVSPSLGASFWVSAVYVSIFSFILLMIVIFAFFRELTPCMAIIAAALFDILAALAAITLVGIPLSITAIAALLTLVGYSVDTNIMLTSRLLKQKDKSVLETTNDAMVTGLTMTSTTLVAALVMLVVSYVTQIVVIYDIAAILFFGSIGEMLGTWMMNAPVLLMFLERKGIEIN